MSAGASHASAGAPPTRPGARSRSDLPALSLIVPARDEEDCLPALYGRILEVLGTSSAGSSSSSTTAVGIEPLR